MLKFLFIPLLLTLMSLSTDLKAQKPVTWSFSAEKNDDQTATLTFTADIQKGWVIYGQMEDLDGPVPTSIEFEQLDGAELKGDIVEVTEAIKVEDDLFMMTVTKFKKQAVFEQTVEVKADQHTITGYVTFMTCDGGRCLPPTDVEFSISI